MLVLILGSMYGYDTTHDFTIITILNEDMGFLVCNVNLPDLVHVSLGAGSARIG
jgi:hypothetical protein